MVNKRNEYEVSTDENAAVATVMRKGSPFTQEFDFDEDTITFLDCDAFMKFENDALVAFGGISIFDSLYQQVDQLTNDRYGKTMVFDLKPYEIDLVRTDGEYITFEEIEHEKKMQNNHIVYYLISTSDRMFIFTGRDYGTRARSGHRR